MMKQNNNDQSLASELLATNFKRDSINQLSDPIVDTPMVVTLDELRPYEFNPRVTKNPLYEDIKASIRERGLDAPPAITKRPGAQHYIIRNGGNTRLSILRELWSETKDEQFFKINCMFRPWQSEIVALTGHLAENELHGTLTFIEKALAVAKARELYEKREQREISQSELARYLTEDGFPLKQSSISRMEDTIYYLLPSIPTALYDGLTRNKVEQLLGFRKSARCAWDSYAEKLHPDPDSLGKEEELSFGAHGTFNDVFSETLHQFDTQAEQFDFSRFRGELISNLSSIFGCTYDEIAVDVLEQGRWSKVLNKPFTGLPVLDEKALFANRPKKQVIIPSEKEIIDMVLPKAPREVVTEIKNPLSGIMHKREEAQEEEKDWDKAQNESLEIVGLSHERNLPATPSRLGAMQAMVASIAGQEDLADERTVAGYAMQVSCVDGLFPVTSLWEIEPQIDDPEKLIVHMGQLVVEIAQELGAGHLVETCDVGLGYFITEEASLDKTTQMVLSLFQALSSDMVAPADSQFWFCLDSLLLGSNQSLNKVNCLSDALLIKLFRVIRLGRRFYELTNLS